MKDEAMRNANKNQIDMALQPDDMDDMQMSAMERETETMLGLMQEIKNMQMASKDPGAAPISDEERRKRAEDMIMKIAGMMDLGDESYGDEDGGDNDEWEQLKSGKPKKQSEEAK